MEINTKPLTSEFKKDTIVHFPQGLAGFESAKNFRLFNSETEKNLFWLQSEDDKALEFAVADPSLFQINYEVTLNADEIRLLDAQEKADIVVLVTISAKSQADDKQNNLHANFMGPIVINAATKLGLQKTLNNNEQGVTITMKG